MHASKHALAGALVLLFAPTLPAAADAASGLPSGKRQHKPFVVTKEWTAYRPAARRLSDPGQRRAALKLIGALDRAKRKYIHQHNQTSLDFARSRADRKSKPAGKPAEFKGPPSADARGGGDVAMEELTLSVESIAEVEASYRDLRTALGARRACAKACERARLRCKAHCRLRRSCGCVVRASDCLLNRIRMGRCGRR